MADILKSFQEHHVPVQNGEVLRKTVMHGDQLTEERARNVQWTFKNGETQEERLEGFNLMDNWYRFGTHIFRIPSEDVSV